MQRATLLLLLTKNSPEQKLIKTKELLFPGIDISKIVDSSIGLFRLI